jgi:hypothetical protein
MAVIAAYDPLLCTADRIRLVHAIQRVKVPLAHHRHLVYVWMGGVQGCISQSMVGSPAIGYIKLQH